MRKEVIFVTNPSQLQKNAFLLFASQEYNRGYVEFRFDLFTPDLVKK